MKTLHKIVICLTAMFSISMTAFAAGEEQPVAASAPAVAAPAQVYTLDLGASKTLTVSVEDKGLPQLTAEGWCARAWKEIFLALEEGQTIGKGTGYEPDAYAAMAKVQNASMPSGQEFTFAKNRGHILLKAMKETQAVGKEIVQPETTKDREDSELITECMKKHRAVMNYLTLQLDGEAEYGFTDQRMVDYLLAHMGNRDLMGAVQAQNLRNRAFASGMADLQKQITVNKEDNEMEHIFIISRINNLARETIALPDSTVFVFDTGTGAVSILLDGTTYPTDLKVDWQTVDPVVFNQENIRWVVNVRLLPEKPGKQYEIFVTNANWQEICSLRAIGEKTGQYGSVRLNGQMVKDLAPSKEETILGKPQPKPVMAAVSVNASASASASVDSTSASASVSTGNAVADAIAMGGQDVEVYSAHRKGLWGREVTESRVIRRGGE